MKSMAVKLYEANRIIENLVFKTLRGRLAAKLLDLAEKFGTKKKNGVEIGLTLSHFDLAELVGTNRETVTKMLRDFRSEGSLEVHKRMFLITDEEKLRAWIN
ncbi:MAG: Crp/Fnr family transcriptional regulator [Candidatus Hydrogenedentota bacterium]|nr:MAG: Crp/Fnr family transcriptional regulator [Candidatus Hydrogenedentota bacterium]